MKFSNTSFQLPTTVSVRVSPPYFRHAALQCPCVQLSLLIALRVVLSCRVSHIVAQSLADQHVNKPQQQAAALEVKFSLTETEIILVEDLSSPDSDALILRLTAVSHYSQCEDSRPLLCNFQVTYKPPQPIRPLVTVELDLIATQMLTFSSKSSRNQNDSDPTNERTTPIYVIMGIISIMSSNDSDDQLVSIFDRVRSSLSNPVLPFV